jgi:hypothetical protein
MSAMVKRNARRAGMCQEGNKFLSLHAQYRECVTFSSASKFHITKLLSQCYRESAPAFFALAARSRPAEDAARGAIKPGSARNLYPRADFGGPEAKRLETFRNGSTFIS